MSKQKPKTGLNYAPAFKPLQDETVVRYVQHSINSMKSALFRHVDRLRVANAKKEADSLERIIGRLEAWQHRLG